MAKKRANEDMMAAIDVQMNALRIEVERLEAENKIFVALTDRELAQAPVGTLLRDKNGAIAEVFRMESGSLAISTTQGGYAVGLAIDRGMWFTLYAPLREDPEFKTDLWRSRHGQPI